MIKIIFLITIYQPNNIQKLREVLTMSAQLSAIYQIAKNNEDYSALKSVHFSQLAYEKCFDVLKAVDNSELPPRIKDSIFSRFDSYYDQIVKSKDVSQVLGRTVARVALKQMSEVLAYLNDSLNFINDDHILAVSIYSEQPPVNDYNKYRFDIQKKFLEITFLFSQMVDELEK